VNKDVYSAETVRYGQHYYRTLIESRMCSV